MATTRDIRLPADSVRALRRSLSRHVGRETAIRALQEAGHAAGDLLHTTLTTDAEDLSVLPEDTFWQRLDGRFRELGWGSIEHQAPHAGVGSLVARDWFEAEEENQACPFTTGVLANLLGHAAGEEVAVLQVPCDGDTRLCVRFLFGAPATLDRLYAGIREGSDVDGSLATLG